jgi:hypothetical protein
MPKFSLPVWASWDWAEKYLPPDIHIDRSEFKEALDLLSKYKFGDRDEGTSVVLGFGLLLRECWRAVEVEGDDEDAPKFLQESLLDMKKSDQVIEAIKKVIGELPSLDADEERPKEKKLDGSTKGHKVKAGQKKPATRKHHTNTPSPGPSTAKKSFGTRKEINSPAKNIRSQRQRKPSKKLRDSD